MRHEAQLNAPVSAKDPKLGTVRAHLELLAARGSVSAIAKLEGPEPPDELLYLLALADDYANGRRFGAHGAEPAAWVDMQAWTLMKHLELDPEEVAAIMLIDSVRLQPGDVEASAP